METFNFFPPSETSVGWFNCFWLISIGKIVSGSSHCLQVIISRNINKVNCSSPCRKGKGKESVLRNHMKNDTKIAWISKGDFELPLRWHKNCLTTKFDNFLLFRLLFRLYTRLSCSGWESRSRKRDTHERTFRGTKDQRDEIIKMPTSFRITQVADSTQCEVRNVTPNWLQTFHTRAFHKASGTVFICFHHFFETKLFIYVKLWKQNIFHNWPLNY